MCTTRLSSQVTIHMLSEDQGSQLWTLFILGLFERIIGIEKFLQDLTRQLSMTALVKKEVLQVFDIFNASSFYSSLSLILQHRISNWPCSRDIFSARKSHC